jgi:heat shock protein HslJ
MRRTALALLLGTVLLSGAACSLQPTTTCGSVVAACSPIPPSEGTVPVPVPCSALTFARCTPTPDDWPRGAQYTATEIDGPDQLVAGTELTVRFGVPHELTVYAGCNHLTVSTHLAGDRLVADDFASTAIGCGADLIAQDAWLQDFFEDGPRWTIDGDTMVLATPDVEITLTVS